MVQGGGSKALNTPNVTRPAVCLPVGKDYLKMDYKFKTSCKPSDLLRAVNCS